MKSKQFFCLLWISLTTIACGQSQSLKEEKMKTDLVEKYVEKTLKEMPQYEVQPMYSIRVSQHSCAFEILVNDEIAYKELFSTDKLASSIDINYYILKSGPQTVTVRMYPLGDILQQEFGEEHHEDILTLLEDSEVSIDLIHVADMKKYSMASEEVIVQHRSPKDEQGKFKGSGLPYYEYTFSFEAKVPYNIEAYSTGVDLRTLDQKMLKAIYEKYVSNYKKLFLEKNIDKLFELKYPSELRASITKYQKEDYIREKYVELYNDYTESDLHFYDSKGADYVFFGNGRIISKRYPSGTLESRKLEKKVLRGKSGIFYLYNENTDVYFLGIDLYMPKSYQGKGIHLELKN